MMYLMVNQAVSCLLQKCYTPRCPALAASPVGTSQMSSSATAGTQAPSWPGEKGWAGGLAGASGQGQGSDTGLLYSLLKVHLQLHGFSVFIDVEKLEAGKFEDKLIQSVIGARNFVLVLSAGALDKCMQDHDCKDWVHKVGAGLCGPSPGLCPEHKVLLPFLLPCVHQQPPWPSRKSGATALTVIGR